MAWKATCVASALLLALGVAVASPALGPFSGGGATGVGGAQGPQAEAKLHATLDMADLKRRLTEKGAQLGSPLMIRIFKAESELEVWVEKDERFELFATYPICNWSGELGPKVSEGDRQSPEGLYSIGPRQLHRSGRWRRSLDIGYPNTFDKAHGRTGSYILVHGGCTTIGCYAMTNRVMEELFVLSEAALTEGDQARIQVHVFPFRMTQKNVAAHAQSQWAPFWRDLKVAYDQFESTRVPPQVNICDNRYVVGEVRPGSTGDCVANISEVSVASARLLNVRRISRARRGRFARRVAHARHAARRSVSRNARRAYAAARASRMANHSAASHLGASRRTRK